MISVIIVVVIESDQKYSEPARISAPWTELNEANRLWRPPVSTFRNDRRNYFKKAIKSVLTHARGPFKLYRYKKNWLNWICLVRVCKDLNNVCFVLAQLLSMGPRGANNLE